MISAPKRMERLESALSGALRAGDRQADELARLSRVAAPHRAGQRALEPLHSLTEKLVRAHAAPPLVRTVDVPLCSRR